MPFLIYKLSEVVLKIFFTVFLVFCACVSISYADGDISESDIEENELSEEVAVLESDLVGAQREHFSTQSLPLNEPKQLNIQLPLIRKNSFIAVGLSSLVPGLGHAYLGDLKTAGSLFGTASLGVSFSLLGDSDNHSYSRYFRYSKFLGLETSWLYGIYAAYRDVRSFNGQSGYLYKMPTDSFTDIELAPFSWKVLKKPEVWGGLLGSLVIAGTLSYFAYYNVPECNFSEESLVPLTAFSVGIGEESLFRGYLQPMFSEYLSPWGGIALSSLLFGAAHIPNALFLPEEYRWRYYSFSLPLITSLGVYFGWLTYKNSSLKESVALHSWYDFVVFAAGSLAASSMITGKPEFAISFSF